MHEKVINVSKAQSVHGIHDPILRDYLRASGSPMVTSNRSRTNGVRATKEVRRYVQQGRLIPLLYLHRTLYTLTVIGLSAVVAAIWG